MTTTPVAIRSGIPLAPAQRPLWASQRRHPDAPVQNMALLTHLDGDVDPDRLAEAFAAVVEANDVLRSRVTDRDGTPLVTLDAEPQPVEVLAMPREAVRAWAGERAATPIDLAQRGSDSAIIRHPDGTTSWYLALHHVITDATSSALVFDATAAVYHGQTPEPTSYYGWVRELQEPSGEDLTGATPAHRRAERALTHWRERTAPPPLDRLYRPAGAPGPGAERREVPLDAALVDTVQRRFDDDLRVLSTDLSWTALLMTVTAAHLNQVASAESVTIGLPVHNRSDAATRSLIGPVMEVFPVDVTVEPGDTFRTLHRRVGRAIMTTLANAVPGTAPTADHQAVVNVIARGAVGPFGAIPTSTDWIHPGAIDASHLLRVQLTAYEGETGQADDDPGESSHEVSGPSLAIDLNRAGADDDHLERAPGHVRRLLEAAVADPDQPIAIDLLDDAERRAITSWETTPDLADPGAMGAAERTVVERLRAALAGRTTVALRHGDRSWTGADLWRRVEEVANHLRQRGIGAEGGERVGIEFPRSADAVIALLATLVAGGSFVPLDPTQPAARRAELARRAGCRLVLTALPTPGDRAIGIEDGPDPHGEAYLLFTSGSTGRPKGVPITHRGLDRYLRFAAASYLDDHPARADGTRDLVVPLFSALTFDLTLTSLFLPLLEGGELVVIDADGPAALTALAEERQVNWAKATPSHLEVLARLLPDDHRLATLVVGGEAFGTGLARRLLRLRPQLAIFNEYGPTEAVVGCMIQRVDPEHPDGASGRRTEAEVPIGRPAPGVTLRIVGPGLRRLPCGAVGELLIASPGLTAGYLDRDDDTGRFVELDGLRFYRSGDLVRLLDPATAVYLGRVDEQVKVGGIRLEPTEVEDALLSHPAIGAAAVRLWTPRPTEPTQRCVRCGLPSNVPGAQFDDAGVCGTCHDHDRVAPQAEAWFRTPEDLVTRLHDARRRRTGRHDFLHLLSGGKDSTYALHRLVELGFEPYALTLDNGFIAEGAKENIRRTVTQLGIDHEFVTSDAMNDIFRDSLERHSNVCHGCYKTIYTLATNRADQLGIPLIVTGLSRGQLFETRLIPAQFRADRFDPDGIDRAVIEARKTYHRLDDGPNRLLDTSLFATDDVFDRIEYLDFYRYVDVELAEMLDYLEHRAPWVRPSDTGRSTNCLINVAGIHTHLTEQGYHNYAIPYAWDVRLGHKTRQEAIDELDDQIDRAEVTALLGEVGYTPNPRQVLTAWLVPADGPDATSDPVPIPSPTELRTFLAGILPAHAIPSAFVTVEALPLTGNGKLDTAALPAPERTNRAGSGLTIEATTELEATVVAVWERVLGLEPISIDDDFFALGGDSLAALEMIVAVGEATGVDVADDAPFLHTTPRSLAAAIASTAGAADHDADDDAHGDRADEGPVDLGPWTDERPPPLSDGERAILFEQSRYPDSVRYNVGRLYRVPGSVDAERLGAAIREVAALHVPLRWTFERPRRRLDPDEAVSIEIRDHTVDPADLEEAVAGPHRAPFDLDRGPLLRVVVQPVGDGTTAILLVCHHASGDAESFGRLLRQVHIVLAGGSPARPPVDVPSFAAWRADRLDPADRAHWLNASTAPATSMLHRPDRPEPDGLLTRSATVTPAELRSRRGATGFAIALAAAAATVRRRLDGDHVELAMITSSRDHAAAEQLFGYFLTTLPVDLDCPLAEPIDALVDRASAAAARNLAARAHPRSAIVAERRAAGRPNPSLEVLVAYDDLSPTRLLGETVQQKVLHNGEAVADLTFFVEVRSDDPDSGPQLDLSVEYRGSVIGADQARLLLDHLDAALTAAVRNPATAIGAIDDPTSASIISGAPLEAPDSLIPAIVAEAAAHPEAAAVRCGDGSSLTWAELDRASARLATQLIEAGAGRGDRVIVAVGRSPHLVTALLGVLRAGAVYVPVDPTYPPDRIDLLVGRSGARFEVVADVPRRDALAAVATVLTVPTAGDDAPVDTVALPDLRADDPAYVIFTSGSTGVPRGVEVDHGHLAASNAARAHVYPEEPTAFLMVSSPSFDSSMVGLFWTLAAGGTVVLPTDRQATDPAALADLLGGGSGPVSHSLLVPTLYQAVLERGSDRPGWAERIIVAGESCPTGLVARHHELRPATALTNEYGPTEASVWCSAHHCEPGDDPVPIGGPIPGTWLAVVDGDDRPVPLGVEGQLVVGGAGVVDGYLDEPEATALRFGHDDRGRFFRTGDRAVVVDDEIRFLGRADHQLSLGGVRVEPEDIEAVLAGDPAVAAVVVTAVDPRPLARLIEEADPALLAEAMAAAAGADDPAADLTDRLRAVGGARRLVAHLEPVAGATIDEAALRDRAAAGLPSPLRPTVFAVHPSLPRAPSGKIDRAAASALAIPERGAGRPADGGSPAAPDAPQDRPTTDTERTVRRVFAEVLQTSDVDPDASFFDLGGHSLLAMELLGQLEDELGVAISAGTLYRRPSVRDLARLIDDWSDISPDDQYRYLIPIQPEGDQPPIFGIHVLGHNCSFYRPLARELGPDQPVFGLGLPDASPDASDPTEVAAVARRYADELERCRPTGPVTLTAVSLGSVVAYELAQQLRARGRTVALLVLFDAMGPDAAALDLSPNERILAHVRAFAADPRHWVVNSGGRNLARLRRIVDRGAVAVRRRIGLELGDDLRVRQFIEANWQSQHAYDFQPYPNRLVVFKASEDLFLARMAEGGMGWAEVATGPFEVDVVPGGHLSMLADPHVPVLAERLAAHQREALADVDAAPIGRGEVEGSLRRALAEGRFGVEVGRWAAQADRLDTDAADLVSRAEAATRDLSQRSRQRSRDAVSRLAAGGFEAVADPVPERSTSVRASIRLGGDPASAPGAVLERAAAALAAAGYRTQSTGTDRIVLVATDDDTTRLDLVADGTGDGPAAGGSRSADADLGVFLGTPPGLAGEVLALADPGPDDVLLDIGCGDGRVLIEAVQRFGCRARGVEIDPALAGAARRRVAEAGLEQQIEIVEGDGGDLDPTSGFGPATVVFLFLPPEVVGELLPTLLDRLDEGARIVAHEQLALEVTPPPAASRLIVDPGITVAHRWDL